MIKGFIMFLDYSKLHIKFFWQLQALHEIAIALYISLQKRNSIFTLFT